MDWQTRHKLTEQAFLNSIGTDSGLILKGGTALMLCYGLDRFSEDLDFDARASYVSTIDQVRLFCEKNNFEYFVKKDTPTVQRCTIHYGNSEHPLKVETSYRRQSIPEEETAVCNGIKTYALTPLASMKLNAYLGRDRIRDLFDMSFLINDHWDDIALHVQDSIRYALMEKGLEQFDVVLCEQQDDLIDPDMLAENFLNAYAKIGLLTDRTV